MRHGWMRGGWALAFAVVVGCHGPTCPPSFAREDGRCVCPEERVLDVTGTSCVCRGNLVDVGARCECPVGLVLDATRTSCGCPNGRVLVGDSCVCPSFEEEDVLGSCVCVEGRVRDGEGACTCPPPTVPSGDACSCPPPRVGSECACPEPFVPMAEACVCPDGLIPDEASGCGCPEGLVLDGVTCRCPEGTSPIDGECIAATCTLPQADCDAAAGCESNLATSTTHCGLCGAGCPGTCANGECDVVRDTFTVTGEAPEGTRVTLLDSFPTRETVADADDRYALELPRTTTRPFLRFTSDEAFYPGVARVNPDFPNLDAYLLDRVELVGFSEAAGVTQDDARGVLVVVVVLEGGRERVTLDVVPDAASATQLVDGRFVARRDEATPEVLSNAWLNLAPGLVSIETDATCDVRFGAPRIFAGAATLVVLGCS